jgi:hyperpolarization activated cyclic nucleotide-gated potassium channel 2
MFVTHLVGCFWYLLAKESGYSPNTWVVRAGIQNDDVTMKYTRSIYWALQTLTTVGFGDINGKTVNERIFAILWMLFGIGVYSILFGNMSNLLESMDAANKVYQEKIAILKEFRKRSNLN